MWNIDRVVEYGESRPGSNQRMIIGAGGLFALVLLVLLGYSALSMVLAKADSQKPVHAPAVAASADLARPTPLSFSTVHGMEFVWCPPGAFTMGSPSSDPLRGGDEREHLVTLSNGFWMARHEVTQAQWESVMEQNPSKFQGASKPVESVSWTDCNAFVEKLNQQNGTHFRLPTEAEWEYACRAGSTGNYSFGDEKGGLGIYATFGLNSGGGTLPVGSKQPNAWGLYDMHGSVWEWCADWFNDYPTGAALNPLGPAHGKNRIIRGGSWHGNPADCRAANRGFRDPEKQEAILGFRLALDAPAPPVSPTKS